MKKVFSLVTLLVVFGASNLYAANFAVITSPPTLLNLVLLFTAIACIGASVKILSALKGGQLFKSWQVFFLAFVVLSLCQIASLLNDFEILAVPSVVYPALLLLSFGLFFYGVFETKKTLG